MVVGDGVDVEVGVDDGVAVGVGDAVAVGVGLGVRVGVGVNVAVGVSVAVGVGVGPKLNPDWQPARHAANSAARVRTKTGMARLGILNRALCKSVPGFVCRSRGFSRVCAINPAKASTPIQKRLCTDLRNAVLKNSHRRDSESYWFDIVCRL